MIGEILLEPLESSEENSKDKNNTEKLLYVDFISKLEGWKTRCKNLHWASVKKNIHVYLDEFLEVLSDYQDALAEEIMGIYGPLSSLDINGTLCTTSTAKDFIEEVIKGTHLFYNNIPNCPCIIGVKSECETFIHNCNKYKYLFSLCAWDMSH